MVHGWIFPWPASLAAALYDNFFTDISALTHSFFLTVDPASNPVSRSMKPLRRGLMSHASAKYSTVLSPHWCSLRPEVWLMKPQFFARSCLAYCLISGRNLLLQFWDGCHLHFCLILWLAIQCIRSSQGHTIHQVCSCRSDSIRNSIFALV